MIKIENIEVMGWEPAIRGMRNPMNSWEKSDTIFWEYVDEEKGDIFRNINGERMYFDMYHQPDDLESFVDENKFVIGKNDLELMMRLAKAGSTHAKYRRMITVYMDVTAPLYWWKEADTYKVGTVANSCSTMHKIHAKEFELDDFSHDHLSPDGIITLGMVVSDLNHNREDYLNTKDKKYWWQMIQLLPSSYNQRRTLMLNYEVLSHMYHDRKDHKLDEWREFCKMIRELPYSQLITLEE